MKPNRVWVIEQIADNGLYYPCLGAQVKPAAAQYLMREYKRDYGGKFRIVPYYSRISNHPAPEVE